MISNITLGKSGLPEYLESGRKASSQYTRDEKDDRLFIDGSIEALSDSIEWVQKIKTGRIATITLLWRLPTTSGNDFLKKKASFKRWCKNILGLIFRTIISMK